MKRRTKAELVLGGGEDEERRRFEPSVWRDVREGDSLLEMEIFGPFLPIVPVEDIDEAIEYINDQCVIYFLFMVQIAYGRRYTILVHRHWFYIHSRRIQKSNKHVRLVFNHSAVPTLITSCNIVLERTRSGNLVFNDVVQQLSVNELPFSGIGESGCTSMLLPTSPPSPPPPYSTLHLTLFPLKQTATKS